MSDLAAKYENLLSALARLAEGVAQLEPGDDLRRDGVIQRFEFTLELTWKTLKACFEDEGLQNLTSPKSVLREAYAAGMIDDEAQSCHELWHEERFVSPAEARRRKGPAQ